MPDEKSFTLTLWRDDYRSQACVEYALIPEGKRRWLNVKAGDQQGSRTDSTNSDLVIVNVFNLNNNGHWGTTNWQFPDRGGKRIVSASIAVLEAAQVAVGTVVFEDGTTGTSVRSLSDNPPPCGNDE